MVIWVLKSNFHVDDPLKSIDWQYHWEKELKELPSHNQSKNWDGIAKKFRKWMEKDDYPEKLLNKIKTKPEYSVLDIGCGEGVITIPLAKKVSEVTAVDLSGEMLVLLREKAQKEGLNNLNYLNGDLRDLDLEKLGKYDVVVASRSLNGVMEIEDTIQKINKIGNYVYITLWGPEGRKYEQIARDLLNKEHSKYPSYIYVYNMLYKMGITANVEKLECDTVNNYNNIEEAMDRYRWKIGDLNSEEEKILRDHLEKTLIVKEDGTLENPYEKPDWVLIWWKNDE